MDKGLLIFLLDQSGSMEDPLGDSSERKMDALATAINSTLECIVILAAAGEGVRDFLDVGVYGYRTDADANPIIETPLNERLKTKHEENGTVTLVDIAENSENREKNQRFVDQETGEELETTVMVPEWVDPMAEFGTPMCYAMNRAIDLCDAWIDHHPDSFPPIVFNITGGKPNDGGDPVEYAAALKERATSDGNVLVSNWYLSARDAGAVMFPNRDVNLADEYAATLFEMSSELPERAFEGAKIQGFDVRPGARAMGVNTVPVGPLRCYELFFVRGSLLRRLR